MDTMTTRSYPEFEPLPVEQPPPGAPLPQPPASPVEPPPSAPPPPPPLPATAGRDGRARRAAALVVLALVAGAAGGTLTRAVDGAGSPTAPATSTAITRPASSLSGESLDVAGVVAAVEPAVVTVEAGYAGGRFAAIGAGTGVILTADGDVLTNAHVVEGASQIRVTLAGESSARDADLVGSDASADLALLHIRGASGLPTAALGQSAGVQVGDDVVAIGNALALRGGLTVTRGIISALDRSLETETGAITGLIQTDASISSGNSGGPLVNAAGKVIGINTAVATGGRSGSAENIGFAIAIDRAFPVVDRLRSGAPAPAAAWLGVSTTEPADGSRGATIAGVEPGSPAAAAGLRVGDLVTHVAGRAVAGPDELAGAVQEHRPGERVDVDVIRGGTGLTLGVILGTRPS